MQWQPIDTAPRDGTAILGYKLSRLGGILHVTSFLVVDGNYGRTEPRWSKFTKSSPPTHWQPLPQPPNRIKDDKI